MADTIRDFFVGLGFKIDTSGERDFNATIGRATLKAELLGRALEGAARKIAGAVARMAGDFERLYYQAQRTNTSVANIRSLAYGLSQLGTSYGSASTSIANFGKAITVSPGTESLVRAMGVQTRDAQGKLRDTVKIYGDYFNAIKRFPIHVREQYAAMVGTDYETMRAIQDQPALLAKAREEQERYAKAIGYNQDEASEKGKNFMVSLRRLQMVIGLVAEKILSDLAPSIQKFVDGITDWIAKNPEEIARGIEAIGRFLSDVAKALYNIAVAIKPVIVAFGQFADMLTGHGSVQGSMEVLAAFMVGSWALRIGAAFAMVMGGWTTLALALGIATGVGAYKALNSSGSETSADGGASTGGGSGGGGLAGMWSRRPTWLGGTGGGGGGGGGGGRSPNADTGIGRRGARASAGDANLTEGTGGGRPARGSLAKNQQEAYAAAREGGLSENAARALVANMSGEALHKPDDHHWDRSHMSQGIVQWDPRRAEAIKNKFGRYPKDMSVAEQTKAAIWEINTNPSYAATKRALADPNQSAAQMIGPLVRNYERPQHAEKAINERLGHLRGFRPGQAPDPKAGPPVTPIPAEAVKKASDAITKVPVMPSLIGAAPPLGSVEDNSKVNNVKVKRESSINLTGGGNTREMADMVLHGQKGVSDHTVRGIQGAVA